MALLSADAGDAANADVALSLDDADESVVPLANSIAVAMLPGLGGNHCTF